MRGGSHAREHVAGRTDIEKAIVAIDEINAGARFGDEFKDAGGFGLRWSHWRIVTYLIKHQRNAKKVLTRCVKGFMMGTSKGDES